MKKFLAMLMSMVVALSLCATAFAEAPGGMTITVTGAKDGAEYNAYKVFDVAQPGSEYQYSVGGDSLWYQAMKAEQDNPAGNAAVKSLVFTQIPGTNKYAVSGPGTTDGTELAAWMNEQVKNGGFEIAGSETAGEGGSAVITVSDPGYYFVDTQSGSLLILDTFTDSAEIADKANGSLPTFDKEGPEYAQVGQMFTYTLTATFTPAQIKQVLDLDITVFVTDTPDSSITVNTVKVDGVARDVMGEDGSFKVELDRAFFEALSTGTVDQSVVITVEAYLNRAVDGGSVNNATLAYGSYNVSDSVTTHTRSIDVVKTDPAGKVLPGAEFELQTADGKKIAVEKTPAGSYVPVAPAPDDDDDLAQVGVPIEAGRVTIIGLSDAAYKLVETKAPKDFNMLTGAVDVAADTSSNTATVENDMYGQGGIQVINYSGVELPSTGGMGTTVLYIVGGVLMLGAVVVLVARKKMGSR